jgi:hypothetical protein
MVFGEFLKNFSSPLRPFFHGAFSKFKGLKKLAFHSHRASVKPARANQPF